VAELLDAVRERGAMDVIGDFAYPLPVTVIAELLGVPPEDRERLKRWSLPVRFSPASTRGQERRGAAT
jgi:cytochrome P450